MVLIISGFDKIVDFLLKSGANPNQANKDGVLPLNIATKNGNFKYMIVIVFE